MTNPGPIRSLRGSRAPSSAEVRLILALWPLLGRRIAALELGREGRGRPWVAPMPDQLRWAGLYELSFGRHLAAAAVAFDMDRELIGAARHAIPVASLAKLTSVYVKQEPRGGGSEVSGTVAAESWMKAGYLRSMRESLRSLLVFGRSINGLVAEAREGADDRRLFAAIRIDPAVLLGTTGAARMARALLEDDRRFARDMHRSMAGGLTPREAAREAAGIAAVETLASAPWQALDDRALQAVFRTLRREAAVGAASRIGRTRIRIRLARIAGERCPAARACA